MSVSWAALVVSVALAVWGAGAAETMKEAAALGKPKRKSIARTLMRDVQGSAAAKLSMFEKVRGAGGFANEHPADLAEAEKMLREFVGMEKGGE